MWVSTPAMDGDIRCGYKALLILWIFKRQEKNLGHLTPHIHTSMHGYISTNGYYFAKFETLYIIAQLS